MAQATITVKELQKVYGDPLVFGKESDMLVVTFMYDGKEYRARQPFEDVSDEGKLIAFLEKVIKKVPSLTPEHRIVNLSTDAKGDYIVTV